MASTWVSDIKVQWGKPLIALGSISADESNNQVEVNAFEANQLMACNPNFANA